MSNTITGRAGSPNYCWQKAGYRIERIKRKNYNGHDRKIYNSQNELIMENGTYESEMKKIHELGIFAD